MRAATSFIPDIADPAKFVHGGQLWNTGKVDAAALGVVHSCETGSW